MTSPTDDTRAPRFPFAAVLVRLIGLWVLTGALFKLLVGTPADLPPLLFKLPLAKDSIYRLAIAAEFAIVCLAFFKPRVGWLAVAACMLVFDVILVTQMSAGAASCGCFGAKIKMPPWVMLAIDSALLLALLASKPWLHLRSRGMPWIALIALAAALASLPWLLDRSAKLPPPIRSGTGGQPVAESQNAPLAGSSLLRTYIGLGKGDLAGKLVYDTQIASLIDIDASNLPLEGTWVLYRWNCDHCASHLREMSASYDGSPLGLLRMKERTDTEKNRVVHILPTGPAVILADLPDSYDYVATTPVILKLEAGVIVVVEENPQH